MSKLTKFQRRVLVSIRDTGRLPHDIRIAASRRASINEMVRRHWIERVDDFGSIPLKRHWRLTAIGGPLLLTL